MRVAERDAPAAAADAEVIEGSWHEPDRFAVRRASCPDDGCLEPSLAPGRCCMPGRETAVLRLDSPG
jgi:hypothetical protein